MRRGDDSRVAHNIELTSVESGQFSSQDESSEENDNSMYPRIVFSNSNANPNGFGIVYGLRSYNSCDAFVFDGFGGILSRAASETTAENKIVAPQLGVVWARSHGKWSFQAQGTALAGYNDGQVLQRNAVGSEVIPGTLNRPVFAQPVYSQHSESHHDFSPGGELRAETSYHFSESLSLKLAWSAILFDNVLLADNRTVYFLPDLGLQDPGNQQLIVQDLYCGIEYLR